MDTFILMFKNVFIFVALAVPGYIMAKSKIITQDKTIGLSKVLTYLGIPFLVFDGTVKISFNGSILTVILLSMLITVVSMFFWFFITKPLTSGFKDIKEQGVARFAMFSFNNGFLGIPLAKAVFGNSDILTAVIASNVINNIIAYVMGIYLISGDKKNISLKNILLNPVLIAFLIGIVLNLTGVNKVIPEIETYSGYFSNIVTPIAMIILGLKMGEVKFKDILCSKRMYYISLINLIVIPVVIVGVLVGINQFVSLPYALIMGTFISFAMPAAGMTTSLADQFNGDTKGAVIYTLGTTLLSVISISVLYYLLVLIIGPYVVV